MRTRVIACSVGILVLAGLVLWGSRHTNAQDGKPSRQQVGEAADEAAYGGNSGVRPLLMKLLAGQSFSPSDKQAKDAIEVSARWLVGRFSHLTVVENLAKGVSKDMDNAIGEFTRIMKEAAHPPNAAKNQEFMKHFGQELAKRFREVFENFDMTDNDRLIVVNAGLMLPHAAKTKTDAIADLLIDLLKDSKKHDLLKLYALKGLTEYFPARVLHEDEEGIKERVEQKVRDAKRIEALRAFLDHKWSDKMDPAAVQFIRREAFAALAQAQVPAVHFQRKQKKLEAPAVYGLIRPLVADSGLTPPPSFGEKCEAAIGLCNLKAAPDYQADVAIYLVGNFLLEFTTEYQQDYANFSRKDNKKQPPLVPWKHHCERLLQGLENLKETTKEAPAYKSAVLLQTQAKPILDRMKLYDNIKTEGLRPEIKKLKPQNTALFKSVPGPTFALP
jgi:hypothetical protein